MRILESLSGYYGPLIGQPILEVLGTGRVLIENHRGVQLYCSEQIIIKVDFGSVEVCGKKMILTKMTKEQLVITGKIEEIKLHGKEEI